MNLFYKINEMNTINYALGVDKPYNCTICGGETPLDSSYSSCGKNLVCDTCLNNIIRVFGISRADALNKIWNS